jgi:AhpD family alkylhydroperoxidase
MYHSVAQKAFRRPMAQIRYVRPVKPGAAQDLVAAAYAQVERDFGMLAPPIALHSPAPETLAASWLMLRETLVVPGLASRAAKEAAAAAVSLGNTCPYCSGVHAAVLGAVADTPEAAAIAGDRIDSVADPSLRDVAAWARASGQREVSAAARPPLPAGQMTEVAGVAVTFHYLNRMVNIFLGESPLPRSTPAGLRGVLMRMTGKMMLALGARSPAAGASLDLLPAAVLPADLSWAAGNEAIAGAFARAAAAIEEAGSQAVPEAVRELVLGQIAGWDGAPRGPSRAWADAAVTGLPHAQRPAGRLALLTAFASYQVVPPDIDDYRRDQPGDTSLIQLTSWASMTAARRVGTWLTPAGPPRSGSAGSAAAVAP